MLTVGNRILGSSGFEHVFLGEKKNGTVQGTPHFSYLTLGTIILGFHNWVYFHHLERLNQLNYLGHWQKVDFAGKGTGLAFTFKWGKEQKPYASMMIGKLQQIFSTVKPENDYYCECSRNIS